MSARRFVPGAGSRVTEVRHTRPRRGLLRRRLGPPPPRPLAAAHWPAPGREAAASSRAPRRAARARTPPGPGAPGVPRRGQRRAKRFRVFLVLLGLWRGTERKRPFGSRPSKPLGDCVSAAWEFCSILV